MPNIPTMEYLRERLWTNRGKCFSLPMGTVIALSFAESGNCFPLARKHSSLAPGSSWGFPSDRDSPLSALRLQQHKATYSDTCPIREKMGQTTHVPAPLSDFRSLRSSEIAWGAVCIGRSLRRSTIACWANCWSTGGRSPISPTDFWCRSLPRTWSGRREERS